MKAKRFLLIIYVLSIGLTAGLLSLPASATSFNSNTALVNTPSAEVLEHLAYDAGVVFSFSLKGEDDLVNPMYAVEEDGRLNIGYKLPPVGMLNLNFELGVSQYTLIEDFKERHDGALNLKWQLLRDTTDKDIKQNIELEENAYYMYIPSVALGIKNLAGATHISSVGPYADYITSNSLYFAATKKFYLKDAFYVKGHFGWGANYFHGSGKDKSLGAFWGVSTRINTANPMNPVILMLDFDGTQYALGATWIYHNTELFKNIMKSETMSHFIPGIKFDFSITDIEEQFRNWDEDKFAGREGSARICFAIGLTNNAYLQYQNYQQYELKRDKKKVEDKEITAAAARKKALELKKRAEAERVRLEAKAKGKEIALSIITKQVKEKGFDVIEEDSKLIINCKVKFKDGTSEFINGSQKNLDELAEVLKKYSLPIIIAGHTDSKGRPVDKFRISVERATKVKNYFIEKHGFDQDKLTIKGFGDNIPLITEGTEQELDKNNRVEIIFE